VRYILQELQAREVVGLDLHDGYIRQCKFLHAHIRERGTGGGGAGTRGREGGGARGGEGGASNNSGSSNNGSRSSGGNGSRSSSGSDGGGVSSSSSSTSSPVQWICGDMCHCPTLPSDSFDVVLSIKTASELLMPQPQQLSTYFPSSSSPPKYLQPQQPQQSQQQPQHDSTSLNPLNHLRLRNRPAPAVPPLMAYYWEVCRVLKEGGVFVFLDYFRSDEEMLFVRWNLERRFKLRVEVFEDVRWMMGGKFRETAEKVEKQLEEKNCGLAVRKASQKQLQMLEECLRVAQKQRFFHVIARKVK